MVTKPHEVFSSNIRPLLVAMLRSVTGTRRESHEFLATLKGMGVAVASKVAPSEVEGEFRRIRDGIEMSDNERPAVFEAENEIVMAALAFAAERIAEDRPTGHAIAKRRRDLYDALREWETARRGK